MDPDSSTLWCESHFPASLVAEGRLGSRQNVSFKEADQCFQSFVMQKCPATQSFVHINISQGHFTFT